MVIHDVHTEMTYHAKCIQNLSKLLESINEKQETDVIQNALRDKIMHFSMLQQKKPEKKVQKEDDPEEENQEEMEINIKKKKKKRIIESSEEDDE